MGVYALSNWFYFLYKKLTVIFSSCSYNILKFQNCHVHRQLRCTLHIRSCTKSFSINSRYSMNINISVCLLNNYSQISFYYINWFYYMSKHAWSFFINTFGLFNYLQIGICVMHVSNEWLVRINGLNLICQIISIFQCHCSKMIAHFIFVVRYNL